MTQITNNTLEDRILDNFGGAIENDLRERERERQVYLQPDGLDSNTYNTYNINIIKYLQYGRHTGTTNICLLPIVQSPWY